MCHTFVYAVIWGSKADYILWLIFGVVVIGNNAVLQLMGNKVPPTPKE